MNSKQEGKLAGTGKVDIQHYKVLEEKYAGLLEDSKKRTEVIIGIFLVSFIVMVISVGTMILDAFHFNSVIYKEYSQKTESLDVLLDTNKELLKSNSKLLEEFREVREKLKE